MAKRGRKRRGKAAARGRKNAKTAASKKAIPPTPVEVEIQPPKEPSIVPERKREVTPKVFYNDVLKHFIASALKKEELSREFDYDNSRYSVVSDKYITSKIEIKALESICIATLTNLNQVIQNGSQYTSSCKRKKFTIDDFEKGLTFYHW